MALEPHAALALAKWLGFYMVLIKLLLLCLASGRVNRALIIWTLPGKCKGTPEIIRKWTKSGRILASLQHGACQIETKHPPLFSGEDSKNLKSNHNITVWKYSAIIKLSFNTEWFCNLKMHSHEPPAKLRYLPLVINKPSQYITFELLKMTETINNLGNIYIEFVDYYAITYQHNIFHHKNTYTSVLHSLALCCSVQPQNWNSQDFQ